MPAIIPFIPAIIGAAGTIGGSLLANRGRSSSTLLPAGLDTTALQKAVTGQQALGNRIAGEGFDTFGQGSTNLQGPLSFYNALLSGDRNTMTETLAPEISAINAQFNAPLREAALFGRNTGLIPDMQAQKQSAISDLFFRQRPMAADKISNIAQQLMSLGTQQQGIGADVLGRTTGQILDYNSIIRGMQQRGSEQNAAMWGQLGSQLGPVLGQVLGGVLGGTGGASTPKAPPVVLPPINPTVPEPPIQLPPGGFPIGGF